MMLTNYLAVGGANIHAMMTGQVLSELHNPATNNDIECNIGNSVCK
jgi:hypothetical protein